MGVTLVNVQMDDRLLLKLEMWLAPQGLRLYRIPPYDLGDTSTWYLVDTVEAPSQEDPPPH